MYVGKDGRVAGSIDRALVAELLKATDDEDLQAYYRALLGESAEGAEYDSPTEPREFDEETGKPLDADEPLTGELEQLHIRAEELGVKVDGRWGVDRLKSEIAVAEEQEG